MVTRALYAATFGEAPEACVLRATDAGVHIHALEAHVLSRSTAIMTALSLAKSRGAALKQRKGGRFKKGGRKGGAALGSKKPTKTGRRLRLVKS